MKLTPANQVDEVFNLVDQNKSVLLLQATKSETAYRLGNLPDSLVKLDKQLQKKQAKLEASLLEKRSQSTKDSLLRLLNNTNGKLDELKSKIATDYPKNIML